MSLTRLDLIKTVAADLAPVLRAVGYPTVDQVGGFKEPADQVFRYLGVHEENLTTAVVATGAERRAVSWLKYLVLFRVALMMGMERDPHPSFLYVQSLLKDASAEAVLFGWASYDPVPVATGISDVEPTEERDRLFPFNVGHLHHDPELD